ncbi:MAG: DUF3899 domain-containing protein [Firmicutes bacterium]|nr:DUF3899 domain-containing protein [Bacillota bacterium]
MNKQTGGRQKNLKRGVICAAAAVVCTFVLSAFSGIFSAKSGAETARILSDSCFFVGALCLGAAGLLRAGGAGIFDGFAYAVKLLLARSFFRGSRGERESYAEFREKRKKSPPVSLWFLAAVGFFLLALASFFLFIFFNG